MSKKKRPKAAERKRAAADKEIPDIRRWQQAQAIRCALAGLPGSIRGGFRIVFPSEPPHACVAIVETPDHCVGVGRANFDGTFNTAPSSPAFDQDVRLLLQREFEHYGRADISLPVAGDTLAALDGLPRVHAE